MAKHAPHQREYPTTNKHMKKSSIYYLLKKCKLKSQQGATTHPPERLKWKKKIADIVRDANS